MKQVCRDCRYAKDKAGVACYCVKYGIIIGYSKTYCISHETERGQDVEQVRSAENGSGRDHVRKQA